jgi:TolB protein
MTAEGAQRQRLTADPGFDEFPSWSPDGQWIIFDSDRAGNFQLYRMRPDGSELQQLTNVPADDAVASLSPKGDQIVFESKRESDQYQIFTMNVEEALLGAAGPNVLRLTHTLARSFHPAWSPDGRRIVFVSERDGGSEIYVMNADGTDQRRLTFDLGRVRYPYWSPDGTLILFSSDRAGNYDLYAMRLDGSAVRQLTTSPADDYDGVWQP